METIDVKDLNLDAVTVAIYNGDPFNVDDLGDSARDLIADDVKRLGGAVALHPGDDEFVLWADRLEFSAGDMPDTIYVAGGNYLAFA